MLASCMFCGKGRAVVVSHVALLREGNCWNTTGEAEGVPASAEKESFFTIMRIMVCWTEVSREEDACRLLMVMIFVVLILGITICSLAA